MRYVWMFQRGRAEDKALLGGKGANLAEMTRMGLPVPPGFTITTDACRAYLNHERLPDGLLGEVGEAMARLASPIHGRFGDHRHPLLVSVRSGAPASMPGMMDTVLNLGLNPQTVQGLAARTDDERFAFDSYRRFVPMYGRIVLGISDHDFDPARDAVLAEAGADTVGDLDAKWLGTLAARYEHVVEERTGEPFPHDPPAQLAAAIEAVFNSWNGRRAQDYRRLEGIADDVGTAVNVQVMVFGNAGDDSGTGVAFTRDPATGEPVPYGDFLVDAQGEDVVAGIRNTLPLAEMAGLFPDCHAKLAGVMRKLEARFQDMCDIEFTIEHGNLFLLQTRVGKRSARAAVRMAVDMANEELIDRATALRRVQPRHLMALTHPRFDPDGDHEVLAKGLNASPGAAVGEAVFTADEAEAAAEAGRSVVLVRPETAPDDLHGMVAAVGILTARGGLVSHAAVVARAMGKPAVCGAAALDIDVAAGRFTVDGVTVNAGDIISIDGTTGQIVVGRVEVIEPDPSEHLATLLDWADDVRVLGIRANADTPEDAARARAGGAEGIGLARTEHMFFGDRLPLIQRMILAEESEDVEDTLALLHEAQRGDFEGILEAMDGLPVTVRLLDPPLHEFLPDIEELAVAAARGELDAEGRALLHAARAWQEHNPMLGIRGVRLGVLRPELYRMQVRALTEAAVARHEAGGSPRVLIMIPLVVGAAELAHAVWQVRDVVDEVMADAGTNLDIRVGTMVETPRAALVARDLARHADFLSFGTNDLTQMVFGFSRDDVEARMMGPYVEGGLLPADPFETLDTDGVGRLMEWAVSEAREVNPDIEIGICGEHGGDPQSVAFCDRLDLDYVSASPGRLGIARLAAAQARLAREG